MHKEIKTCNNIMQKCVKKLENVDFELKSVGLQNLQKTDSVVHNA